MILSHNSAQLALSLEGSAPCEWLRPASLSRHLDETPTPARPEGRRVTPLLSHPYKCPHQQLLSFDNLTNAWGVWGVPSLSTLQPLNPSQLIPLAATLMDPPISVANKGLTGTLTPLDAALTRNRGAGLRVSTFRPSDAQYGQRRSHSAQHQCYHAEETYY